MEYTAQRFYYFLQIGNNFRVHPMLIQSRDNARVNKAHVERALPLLRRPGCQRSVDALHTHVCAEFVHSIVKTRRVKSDAILNLFSRDSAPRDRISSAIFRATREPRLAAGPYVFRSVGFGHRNCLP